MDANSRAEVKIRKFREPLSESTEGNPEPSLIDKEGAETRNGLCLKCGELIPSHKYKNAKYCSDRCRSAYISYKHCLKIGKFKKPGVGSGGNQWGTDNPSYKNGIGTFQKKAYEAYGKICNRCRETNKLLVHHKDKDRTNNVVENLEVLCHRCHRAHHNIRDKLGKFCKQT